MLENTGYSISFKAGFHPKDIRVVQVTTLFRVRARVWFSRSEISLYIFSLYIPVRDLPQLDNHSQSDGRRRVHTGGLCLLRVQGLVSHVLLLVLGTELLVGTSIICRVIDIPIVPVPIMRTQLEKYPVRYIFQTRSCGRNLRNIPFVI